MNFSIQSAFLRPSKRQNVTTASNISSSNQAQVKQSKRKEDSPLICLTVHLVQTYKSCNSDFKPVSKLPRRVLTQPSESAFNDGLDNEDSNLICRVHDVLECSYAKYTILDLLGTGTFGQVFRSQKDDTKEVVAIKIIKNKPAYHAQGQLEAKIARLINNKFDLRDERHIVRLQDYFECKGHICLVFELLSMSLLDILTQNQFRGLPINVVQRFTRQILAALVTLQEADVIHCDLKPENILLCPPKNENISRRDSGVSGNEGKSLSVSPHTEVESIDSAGEKGNNSQQKTAMWSDIKVIDLGSACFEGQTMYSYIQSRFYRSPEVLLGVPYNGVVQSPKPDWW